MDQPFKIVGSITRVHTIAVSTGIRELANLRKLFGAGRWRKLKGIAVVQLPSGMLFRAEVHWYEAHGIGKRKIKIKTLLERLS